MQALASVKITRVLSRQWTVLRTRRLPPQSVCVPITRTCPRVYVWWTRRGTRCVFTTLRHGDSTTTPVLHIVPHLIKQGGHCNLECVLLAMLLVCVLHIKPFLLPVDVRPNWCTYRFFFSSAPETERKPLSILISRVYVYRFEPDSFLPPWSGRADSSTLLPTNRETQAPLPETWATDILPDTLTAVV